MRDISDRFKNEQNNDNRKYLKYADITLADGTVINLTNADFWSNGMKFEDSVSDDNTFKIGSANINTLNLSINNFDGKYTDYDFTDATVICYVGIELEPEDTSALLDTTGDKILDTTGNEIIVHKNALIEKIRICTMTVIDTPYQNTTIIELECEDNMRKFDRDYSASKLKYPATRKQIIQDACKVCGVTLDTLNFYQDSYQIPARPDDEALTFRQVIAWTCQIGCQYARCDKYGRLTIKWYDTEITDANRATIKSTNGFTPNLDDVVITGVQVTEYLESTSTDEEASSYLYGEEGYVLKISANKLIPQGTGEVVANIIGEKCVGMSFRPFETECLTDIVLEAGDAVLITDRKGNKYKSFLTNVVLQPGSFEQISCNAESAARNSSKTYSLATQAAVDARKSVWRERTTREQALQEFKDRLDNSTGVYTTVQTQQDGSQIFYLHDKPTLAESKAVWKMTAEAWGVSTDGGQTWNGGMTVDGDTIVRILNAVGVNADWINAGAITVTDTDGSIIFSVDMDTGTVTLDGSYVTIGGKPLDEKIEDVENMAALARNMTIQLDNDYQGIPVDSDGNYTEFPECTTTATIMYGTQDITDNCTYTITTSQNIQGSWNKENKTYTVTGLTADSGWVNIKAAYLNNLVVSKQFSLAKQYAGPQGIPGVGIDGKTTYLHIQYAPVQNPTAAQMSKTPDKYIGTYTDFSGVDSTDPSKYTWAKFEGDQGAQGPKGADGKSSYTWMKYATRPDGLDMSDNPDYVPLLDSTGSPILDSAGEQIYTVTQATYIGIATNKDTATESTNPADYTWSRFRGVDGYDGKDGANGIPGKDGKDGKTQYTHLAYANSADGTKDFSVSDGNREYIGMYVDFVEADSTDPTKYTWSLIKGANGAQGVPGTPGANGKTPYFHIAYANSADGRTGFSVDDSVNKLYIGQYTDYTPDDSTDPARYSWTKIKGEPGAAGRTYFFQSNADVLLMGADKKITPAPLIVDSFYRDGNGEVAQSQKGWWKLEKSTDSGATWATLTVSQTAALDRLNINVNSLSLKAHDMLKVSLYFDQSKTKLADYQTYPVAVDVASLTQEQIVDILSDGGKFKGLYYGKDESGNQTLYISFNAAKGGTLALGGQNDGNGLEKIYDSSGSLILTVGQNGIETRATTLTDKNANGKIAFNKKGLTFTEDIAGGGTGTDEDLHLEKSIISFDSLANIIGELDKLTVRKDAKIEGRLLFYDYENQSKKASEAVTRQPIASVTADGNRVAFLNSGYHANGYGAGTEHSNYRLGVKAQWGGSSYEMHYIYTNLNISDIRLKENVKNSETDALETINQMKVRQFDWKERMGGWHQNIGFVADELEEIDPNLALGGGYDENGEMDIKQINSPYLLNYAIKAIQELSAKVEAQEKRIKELERRLQDGKI